MKNNLYQFSLNALIGGERIDLIRFKGKKIMIVNVASECGYTTQYSQLQELHENFKDNITIIACPSNDFGGQEPGTNDEISTFCERNYGVTFVMTQKIKVVGQDKHPLYNWLSSGKENGVADNETKWNFHKYLINSDGTFHTAHPSSVLPIDTTIIDWVLS